MGRRERVRWVPMAVEGTTLGRLIGALNERLRALGNLLPGVLVRKNSTAGADIERTRLNFIEGTNVTITVADDATDDEVDITIAASGLNVVVLASDVVNNNAVANTIADVTGLSFAVTAGETYWYEFVIPYTSAATTTGSRWAINGPAAPTMLNGRSEYTLTDTSVTVNCITAYDIPAASNATSLTAGNVATIWGVIKPSSNGTVIARFASEVASSAITAKAGATLRWMRVL